MYSRKCGSSGSPRAGITVLAGVVLAALGAAGCSAGQAPSASPSTVRSPSAPAGTVAAPSASASAAQPPLTWSSARAPLPAGAASSGQLAAVWAVSCPAPGTCLAGGHYASSGGQPRFLIETLSDGTWTASARPLPAGAAANQEWSQKQSTTVDGLGCRSVSYCVVPASYVANGGATVSVIETLSGGTWTVASEPLPADAVAGSKQDGYLALVSCPGVGSCLTSGAYTAESGMQGLIVTGAVQHG
jgi:hypothetical protein